MVAPVHIPPIRERKEDVLPIANHFLNLIGQRTGENYILTTESEEALLNHDFPGNTREIRNIMERAATFCSGSKIFAGGSRDKIEE